MSPGRLRRPLEGTISGGRDIGSGMATVTAGLGAAMSAVLQVGTVGLMGIGLLLAACGAGFQAIGSDA
ncbi:hypothetical protein Aam_112_006 [Acidocella aminolytica 101 = DSM 11237]|uniref:Uncharacterized protein n=1 Tax=Acidocella aminolytica 101 = DSM 11237 TaxID=1120923 RepID=A0A0D6PJW0_9PROT|nr:hypothetical protein Aam_112_006 [Acidocella aminolytica 101 = DSM 11237]